MIYHNGLPCIIIQKNNRGNNYSQGCMKKTTTSLPSYKYIWYRAFERCRDASRNTTFLEVNSILFILICVKWLNVVTHLMYSTISKAMYFSPILEAVVSLLALLAKILS